MKGRRKTGWTWLRRVALGLLVVILLLALAAWIASIVLRPHLPTHDQVVKQARAQAQLSGGAQVFATHCADCHATKIGPWLGGLDLNADTIRTFVRAGPGPMPAFTPSQVSDADITALAAYLQTVPAKKDDAK